MTDSNFNASDNSSNNPLLSTYDLAPFSEIKPEYIEPAIKQTLEWAKSEIENLLKNNTQFTWENLMQPIEALGNVLDKRWSPVSHINSVTNSDEIRNAYDACLPLLSEYSTWLGQNKVLFEAVQQLYNDRDKLNLDSTQEKILADELRDFRLAGVALPDDKKARYGEIQRRLSELSSKYEQNVLDATMSWEKHFVDASELSGLPESVLGLIEQNAKNAGKSGYLLNLEFPCYYGVISYADNRDLRQEVYRAYSTRASELSDSAKYDNLPIMNEILALRLELAQILGFSNYAELSIASKMAEAPKQILDFLSDLADKSKPQAQQELGDLKEFAKTQLNINDLQAWDVAYTSEKLKQHKYAVSQEELRPYFPVKQVQKGLFNITEQLFGVQVKEITDQVNKWHQDVQLFELQDSNGEQIARFYVDLFARSRKRGGAWMADYCSRFILPDGGQQKPVAFLTCNFNPPVGNKPALLTHDEVVTLFHEFGHGLHHMLTKVNYLSASGIHGVEWDAVELPSQFMENFCYEKEGLQVISGHYETGEPLPDDLRDKLQAAKNFQSAMMMVRQLEFSIFDLHIHSNDNPAKPVDIQTVLDTVRSNVAVITPPQWNRFQNSFSHIFAGGYSAGYYSYKWAEVLSADAFSKFEEDGIFSRESGEAFKQHILEKGGSQPAMELFKNFRGREPSIEPLLRHSGIAA
ncbi:MAG: oligopeptidase A [Gammaproteobacteria bacterium]|nr:oligopeptidase A [Gammaproteobacteria bacterium]